MYGNTTIAAIATPAGAGAIGVVRISGPEALGVAGKVFFADNARPLAGAKGYSARLGVVRAADGTLIDRAVALVFRAPKSYTGEDVAELQCHGGEIALAETLRSALDAGAEPASAGEFTRRAFENGKLSLSEAEAIAELISAASKQGEAAAAALAGGSLRRRTDDIKRELIEIQSALSANIDFPEEDVEEIDRAELSRRLLEIGGGLCRLINSYEGGAAILRGIPAAIVGSPNVGKSTLMNLLAGCERSIVTPIAGTTRDVLEQRVRLGNLTLILADTAGIRDAGDEIEREGVSRALRRIDESALALAVFDSSRALSSDDELLIDRLAGRRAIAVINKTDLDTELDCEALERRFENTIYISAKDSSSLETLERAITKAAGAASLSPDEPLLATERQRRCAVRANEAVAAAESALLDNALDAAFAMLFEAIDALCELSGENASEKVLEEVFSRFCVGK